eukprot:m.83420 g.83420  ORF g.83420 m.83420 type:complete len:664 (-) comp8689_c0_seq1:228-2219(-)
MPLEREESKPLPTHLKEYFLSFIPFIKWLPHYSLSKAQNDIVAGLTVGLMVVPQGLAYASIAGLDEQYGLYSAFMGCFVYIFMGTAKDITLGPTAIMSLMTASNSDQINGKTIPEHAIFLTFMAGLIQLAMGIFRLGFIVDFIAYPVISGFTSAAAITIGFGQVKNLLGLQGVRRPFIEAVHDTFYNIGDTIIADLLLGFVCLVCIFLLKRLKEKYETSKSVLGKTLWLIGTARNALIVALAAIFVYALLNTNKTSACVKDPTHINRWCFNIVGSINSTFPKVAPPSLSKNTIHNGKLMKGAVVIALIGYLESIAIGKAFARQNRYEIDTSQELVAIGSGNIVSSFFQSYPITGSFSRTAVNAASGVSTPLGGATTGIIVILALEFLTGLFKYIPKAALASIIIASVANMIKYKVPISIFRVSLEDILPFFVSFFGSLLIGIEEGVGIAVGVNVLYVLYFSARPGNKLLAPSSISDDGSVNFNDGFHDVKYANGLATRMPGGIMILQIGSNLLFPGASNLAQTMLDLQTESKCPAIVLDCRKANYVDFTGMLKLQDATHELGKRNTKVVLAGANENFQKRATRAGLAPQVEFFDDLDVAIVQTLLSLTEQHENGRDLAFGEHDRDNHDDDDDDGYSMDIGVVNEKSSLLSNTKELNYYVVAKG